MPSTRAMVAVRGTMRIILLLERERKVRLRTRNGTEKAGLGANRVHLELGPGGSDSIGALVRLSNWWFVAARGRALHGARARDSSLRLPDKSSKSVRSSKV